jgi:glucose-6-phosphate isomerase
MLPSINPQKTAAWSHLDYHINYEMINTLSELFDQDPERFSRFSLEACELFFDYSKTHITDKTMKLLFSLAQSCELSTAIEQMFSGEKINETEQRAVLHTALRDFSDTVVEIDGKDVMPEIRAVREQMKIFSEKLHRGIHTGFTGKKIDTIVNIGIGGSDLGPNMVCRALKHYAVPGMKSFFVSNVDGSHLLETLTEVDPETTLFLIVSKTFTTQETMTNAHSARQWFLKHAPANAIEKHFVAVSTNEKAVCDFGIHPDNIFRFWDFVGGRFSLWSAVGLSIACYVGYDNFEKLLKSAGQMDLHFRNTPFEQNLPVIFALTGILYNNFYHLNSEVVLPYDQYLDRFPAYLQQAIMESNGKSIDRQGYYAELSTSPVVWGEPGTNGQHSFYQLIHQGTNKIPCIFMAPAIPLNDWDEHHKILISNFLAQTEALMNGKSEEVVLEELKNQNLTKEAITKILPYKIFDGDIPSISILYKQLTPETLGALIALFEHRIFVQGIIWNIYSFDQFGVELGKQLAQKILPELEDSVEPGNHDSSTMGLIRKFKAFRQEK